MDKRPTKRLEERGGPPEDLAGRLAQERASFLSNRADSIEWACREYDRDPEVRALLGEFRRRFRDQIAREPQISPAFATMLEHDQGPGNFLTMLADFTVLSHSESACRMAISYCERLKDELNLDLDPTLFDWKRPEGAC